MATPTYTLPTGQTISSGSTPTASIPQGYSFDASGKLTNASGQEYTTPTAQPTTTPVTNPVTAPTTTPSTAPVLPTPTAPAALQTFFGTATSQVQSAQAQADAALKQRSDANQAALDAANQKQTDLQTLQANGMATDLADVQAATAAKQSALTLEQSQYQQNYDLNQGFISQMQTLVTQGNAMIEQTKQLPIASNILNSKVNQTVSDLAAQVGSLQTLMSAASGQMAAAKTQLDTTVATISSILQDQNNYYTALQSFYDGQSKTNETQIATLTKDQKDYLDQQITQSQAALAQVQKNAQALADAMTNPDTALAYNQAGVTVNDTTEQINQKLATYAYSKELSTQSQTMVNQGYSAAIPGQAPPPNSTTLTVKDSKGVSHTYYKTSTATSGGTSLTKTQYAKLTSVGVSSDVANAITSSILSGEPLDQIRQDIRDAGGDPAVLDQYDNVVGIASLLKNAKTGTGFQ